VSFGWRFALQEVAQVFEQQRLGFLDTDRGGGVAREDVGDAFANAGQVHQLGDLVRDIHELDGRVGCVHQSLESGGDARRVPQLHRLIQSFPNILYDDRAGRGQAVVCVAHFMYLLMQTQSLGRNVSHA
jgi:hypothetical protein